MSEQEKLFREIGEKLKDSIKGNLFGKPCFKVNKKAFVCFFQNEMVFKLKGEAHQEALSLDASKLFDPSGKGRPMKEWVQVPYDYKEMWVDFAKAAIAYVGIQK